MATGLKINNLVDTTLQISTKELVWWFNALRNLPVSERTRALDAFWAGQIDSKSWLVNTLNSVIEDKTGNKNVYIFGGWIGVLGSMLLNCSNWNVGKIRSVDIDPWCEAVADSLNCNSVADGWKFKAVTADMGSYGYDWDIPPDIIINTSTEHVDQGTYDQWWDRIPGGCLVVVQGNDFFSCPEHCRCSVNLADFKRMNHIVKPVWEGSLPHDLYTRFMAIFIK